VKKLRCWLGFHRYANRKNDDGGLYRECRDCGKFADGWRDPSGGGDFL
jgi:hypothetical protein